ncbi:hypothetical protein [Candidatus Frankia alpina]|uniref:hypothetical protein n=1 Tax=Candidatus Frankia alpina TaxID=2699483 RepID=UPI0039A1AA87
MPAARRARWAGLWRRRPTAVPVREVTDETTRRQASREQVDNAVDAALEELGLPRRWRGLAGRSRPRRLSHLRMA